MSRTIGDLVVGDRFHARYPDGANPYTVVAAVHGEVIEAHWMGGTNSERFSRATGLQLDEDRPDRVQVIDSVAVLPSDLVAILDERDRRFRDWLTDPNGLPRTSFPRRVEDQAAVEEARRIFRSTPLHTHPSAAVLDLIARALDTTLPSEQRAEAARILGRHDFPEVVEVLLHIASTDEAPDVVVESAARGIAGLFSDRESVDEQMVNQLRPVARELLHGHLPWMDVGRLRYWCCRVCGVDTNTIEEYYMLHRALWIQVSPAPRGHLCIGCVEDRLGRTLTADDFTDKPINTDPDTRRSARLTDRLSRTPR